MNNSDKCNLLINCTLRLAFTLLQNLTNSHLFLQMVRTIEILCYIQKALRCMEITILKNQYLFLSVLILEAYHFHNNVAV